MSNTYKPFEGRVAIITGAGERFFCAGWDLKAAAEGENEEWTDLYPTFAEIAKEEGFPKIASAFKMIAKVEAEHEKRYLKLLQNVSEDKVFMKDGKVWWECMNCGYIYESAKALENCPACLHPQSYMKLKGEDY